MGRGLKNNQPSILVLADFSDGSWHAASFAMQFLYKEKQPFSILQTYQNPGWGHLMMRKLSHHLKKITKSELKALKNNLLKHFEIERQKVNILSIEGELSTVLNCKPIISERHHLVLSTHSSFEDSCKRQNGCLERIIDTAQHPLFIIPETFEGISSKKILFVANPNKIPSVQLCREVIEICKKTQSGLEILFVMKSQKQTIPETLRSFYHEYFEEIDVSLKLIQNKSKCKGINQYLAHSDRDLIVVESD